MDSGKKKVTTGLDQAAAKGQQPPSRQGSDDSAKGVGASPPRDGKDYMDAMDVAGSDDSSKKARPGFLSRIFSGGVKKEQYDPNAAELEAVARQTASDAIRGVDSSRFLEQTVRQRAVDDYSPDAVGAIGGTQMQRSDSSKSLNMVFASAEAAKDTRKKDRRTKTPDPNASKGNKHASAVKSMLEPLVSAGKLGEGASSVFSPFQDRGTEETFGDSSSGDEGGSVGGKRRSSIHDQTVNYGSQGSLNLAGVVETAIDWEERGAAKAPYIQDAQRKIAELENEIHELQEAKADLQQRLALSQVEVAAKNAEVEEKTRSRQEEVERLSSQIHFVEEELSGAKEKQKILEREAQDKQATIDRLKAEAQDAEKRLADKFEEYKTSAAQIADFHNQLQTKHDDLERDNLALKETKQVLDEENARLERKAHELEHNLHLVGQEKREIEEVLVLLQQQKDALEEEKKRVEQDLGMRIGELDRKLEQANAREERRQAEDEARRAKEKDKPDTSLSDSLLAELAAAKAVSLKSASEVAAMEENLRKTEKELQAKLKEIAKLSDDLKAEQDGNAALSMELESGRKSFEAHLKEVGDDYSRELKELQEANQRLKDDNDRLTEERQGLDAHIATLESDNKEFFRELEQLRVSAEKFAAEMLKVTKEKEAAEERFSAAKARADVLEDEKAKQAAEAKAQKEAQEAALQELQKQLAAANANQKDPAVIAELEAQVAAAKKALADAQAASEVVLKELQRQLDQAVADKDLAERQASESARQLRELQATTADTISKATFEAKKRAAEAELALADARKSLVAAEAKLLTLNDDLKASVADVDALKQQLAAQKDATAASVAEKEAEIAKLRADLEEANAVPKRDQVEIDGLMAQIAAAEKALVDDRAAAAAAKEALEAKVAEALEKARVADQKALAAAQNFSQLNDSVEAKIKEAQDAAAEKVRLAETSLAKVQKSAEASAAQVAELDGKLKASVADVDSLKKQLSAQAAAAAASVAEKEAEIAKLRADLEEANAVPKRDQVEIDGLMAQIAAAEKALVDDRAAAAAVKADLEARLDAEVKRASEAANSAIEAIDKVSELNLQLKQRTDELATLQIEHARNLELYSLEIARVEKFRGMLGANSGNGANLADFNAQVETARRAVEEATQHRLRVLQLEKELAAAKAAGDDSDEKRSRIVALEKDLQAAQVEKERAAKKADDAQRQLDLETQRLAQEYLAKRDADTKLLEQHTAAENALRDKIAALKDEMQTKDAAHVTAVRELQGKLRAAEEDVATSGADAAAKKREIDGLKDDLARMQREKDESDKRDKATISDLEQRLAAASAETDKVRQELVATHAAELQVIIGREDLLKAELRAVQAKEEENSAKIAVLEAKLALSSSYEASLGQERDANSKLKERIEALTASKAGESEAVAALNQRVADAEQAAKKARDDLAAAIASSLDANRRREAEIAEQLRANQEAAARAAEEHARSITELKSQLSAAQAKGSEADQHKIEIDRLQRAVEDANKARIAAEEKVRLNDLAIERVQVARVELSKLIGQERTEAAEKLAAREAVLSKQLREAQEQARKTEEGLRKQITDLEGKLRDVRDANVPQAAAGGAKDDGQALKSKEAAMALLEADLAKLRGEKEEVARRDKATIDGLQAQLETVAKAADEARARFAAENAAALKEAEARADALRNELTAVRAKAVEQEAEMTALKAKLQAAEAANTGSERDKEEIAKLQEQLDKLTAQQPDQSGLIATLRERVNVAEKDAADLRQQLTDLHVVQVQAEQQRAGAVKQQIQDLQVATDETVAKQQVKIDTLERQLAEARAGNTASSAAKVTIDGLTRELEGAKRDRDAAVNDAQRQKADLESRLKAAEKKAEDAGKVLQTVKDDAAARLAAREAELRTEFAAETQKATRQQADQQTKITKLEADLRAAQDAARQAADGGPKAAAANQPQASDQKATDQTAEVARLARELATAKAALEAQQKAAELKDKRLEAQMARLRAENQQALEELDRERADARGHIEREVDRKVAESDQLSFEISLRALKTQLGILITLPPKENENFGLEVVAVDHAEGAHNDLYLIRRTVVWAKLPDGRVIGLSTPSSDPEAIPDLVIKHDSKFIRVDRNVSSKQLAEVMALADAAIKAKQRAMLDWVADVQRKLGEDQRLRTTLQTELRDIEKEREELAKIRDGKDVKKLQEANGRLIEEKDELVNANRRLMAANEAAARAAAERERGLQTELDRHRETDVAARERIKKENEAQSKAFTDARDASVRQLRESQAREAAVRDELGKLKAAMQAKEDAHAAVVRDLEARLGVLQSTAAGAANEVASKNEAIARLQADLGRVRKENVEVVQRSREEKTRLEEELQAAARVSDQARQDLITNHTAALQVLEARVVEFREAFTAEQAKVADRDGQIRVLNAQLQAAEARGVNSDQDQATIVDLRRQLNQLTAQQLGGNEAVVALRERVAAAEADAGTLRQQLATLRTEQIQAQQDRAAALEAQRREMQATVDARVAEQQARITELQQQLRQAQTNGAVSAEAAAKIARLERAVADAQRVQGETAAAIQRAQEAQGRQRVEGLYARMRDLSWVRDANGAIITVENVNPPAAINGMSYLTEIGGQVIGVIKKGAEPCLLVVYDVDGLEVAQNQAATLGLLEQRMDEVAGIATVQLNQLQLDNARLQAVEQELRDGKREDLAQAQREIAAVRAELQASRQQNRDDAVRAAVENDRLHAENVRLQGELDEARRPPDPQWSVIGLQAQLGEVRGQLAAAEQATLAAQEQARQAALEAEAARVAREAQFAQQLADREAMLNAQLAAEQLAARGREDALRAANADLVAQRDNLNARVDLIELERDQAVRERDAADRRNADLARLNNDLADERDGLRARNVDLADEMADLRAQLAAMQARAEHAERRAADAEARMAAAAAAPDLREATQLATEIVYEVTYRDPALSAVKRAECEEAVAKSVAKALKKIDQARKARIASPLDMVEIKTTGKTTGWDEQFPFNLFSTPAVAEGSGVGVARVINLTRLDELERKMRDLGDVVAVANIAELRGLIAKNTDHITSGNIGSVSRKPLTPAQDAERKRDIGRMTEIINGKTIKYSASGEPMKIVQQGEGLLGSANRYNSMVLNASEVQCVTVFGLCLSREQDQLQTRAYGVRALKELLGTHPGIPDAEVEFNRGRIAAACNRALEGIGRYEGKAMDDFVREALEHKGPKGITALRGSAAAARLGAAAAKKGKGGIGD